jgi:hypothetical protein
MNMAVQPEPALAEKRLRPGGCHLWACSSGARPLSQAVFFRRHGRRNLDLVWSTAAEVIPVLGAAPFVSKGADFFTQEMRPLPPRRFEKGALRFSSEI